MTSEAQKRANQKYKANVKRFTIDFTPMEMDIYNYLSSKINKQRYIKDLIADEMISSEKMKKKKSEM